MYFVCLCFAEDALSIIVSSIARKKWINLLTIRKLYDVILIKLHGSHSKTCYIGQVKKRHPGIKTPTDEQCCSSHNFFKDLAPFFPQMLFTWVFMFVCLGTVAFTGFFVVCFWEACFPKLHDKMETKWLSSFLLVVRTNTSVWIRWWSAQASDKS